MQSATNRRYAMEGGVHLYSSEPTLLTPADLYLAKSNPAAKQALENCNIYVIAARGRILIHPEQVHLERGVLYGYFIVIREHGFEYVPFEWKVIDGLPGDGKIVDIAIALTGTHLCVQFANRNINVAANIVVAEAKSELTDTDRDLEVLYVGQGIGKSSKRSALDRLSNHSTFQRILAEGATYHPGSEIVLLLYRFEHRKTYVSTGGDLRAEPQASVKEEHEHFHRMGNVELTRSERITLAEAALIRHFQPQFNTQLKDCDFAARRKIKALEQLIKKDMTGLIVEICTANIRSRLRTPSAPPLELSELFTPEVLNGSNLKSESDKQEWMSQLTGMAHTQFANFPLTTPDERDTFMHGTIWNGTEERTGFMSGGKTNPI